jgi:hypothetical protein
MMNEKAVSEAIGFVLILGIVISGIGLVTLYGYPVLVKEQSNTDVKNMERAMIVIQNDMKSLCFKNVPYKETSLQVSGGTLEVIDAGDSESSFEVSTSDGWTYPVAGQLQLGELRYRSDRGTEVIALENGAVVKRQEDSTGSAMLAEPRWFYDGPTKTFVIYFMNISADGPMAKSGMGAVSMSLDDVDIRNYEIVPPNPPITVTVTYSPGTTEDYETAWENYLTGSSVGMSGSRGTYTLSGVERLVVKTYRIQIHDI